MENPEATSPDAAAASLSQSDQARIRRERRRAKVTQGADRLKKLTQTQKSPDYDTSFKDDEIAAQNKPVTNGETHDDPPVADIAEHDWRPRATPRAAPGPQNASPPFGASEDEFRQLMAAGPFMGQQQQQQQRQGGMPGQPGMGPQMSGMEDDPMMKLMQQLMGMPPGSGGPGGAMPQMGPDGLPPGLASMFGGGNGEQQASDMDPYAKRWTVLHSVCAILLGLYAAWITNWNFSGSKEQRMAGMHEDVPIFWYFATMELILQSTRYILERGRPPPGSILSKIGSFLPPPFGPFLMTIARYSVIWSTVVNDGALLLFVLGVLSWWNSRESPH